MAQPRAEADGSVLNPLPSPLPTLLLPSVLELERRARAEKGLECTGERHIRDSAQSWRPEPGKASKARGRPCVRLASDDRAEVLISSRATLLEPPL